MLFVGREDADVGDDGGEQGVRRVVAEEEEEGFYQAVFAEFFVTMVHGFGHAVGIKRQQIAATERPDHLKVVGAKGFEPSTSWSRTTK